jgi:(4S)-4-hydroxy-5-phosphonooxypentane-2,3-dione isomerase
VRLEPGCLRFDVLVPADPDAPQVVLYEIYVDRAAFDRHLATRHYLEFDRRTRAMVRQKAVRTFSLGETAADPADAPG